MGNNCAGCMPNESEKANPLQSYDNQEEAMRKMQQQSNSQQNTQRESKEKLNNNGDDMNKIQFQIEKNSIGGSKLQKQQKYPQEENIFMESLQKNFSQGNQDPLEMKGEVKLEDGVTYFGQWRGELREGYGIQRWPDGAQYEGEWKQDRAEGKGKFTHTNGNFFEDYQIPLIKGEWKNDQANGQGKFFHKDGSYYQGSWKDDLQDGFGVLVQADGSKYEGYQVKGRKQGQGKQVWSNGSSYDGIWLNNQLEGNGIYTWKDGRIYNGMWKENCMHGNGKYSWPDGRFYQGQFVEDKRNGYGIYQWKEGKRYEGNWYNGKQHNKGKYIFPNGDISYGIFQNGQLVRSLSQNEFESQNIEQMGRIKLEDFAIVQNKREDNQIEDMEGQKTPTNEYSQSNFENKKEYFSPRSIPYQSHQSVASNLGLERTSSTKHGSSSNKNHIPINELQTVNSSYNPSQVNEMRSQKEYIKNENGQKENQMSLLKQQSHSQLPRQLSSNQFKEFKVQNDQASAQSPNYQASIRNIPKPKN